ncbi:hypothetical protein AURDEDRAFT_166319 [Auricularia subglabra TFB-10046 SS5]|uniref:F-box domain-containing protein n=1 Tax=Auricularia subglabra (strain TFB-10046 / SS5) TaxID=717982 RepID=J0WXL2_AURST|nr:hypothetical protein AURDEDRAFT_166319 [Auricularia subglabra TFB-10046 SS5]
MLIPALAQCLPRIVTLSIVCDEEFINDVVAALRAGPAPRLKVFKFYGYQHEPRPSTKMKVLPLDLFSGEAPLLRVLQMDACQFPEVPVPAFASVRELIRVADRRAEENYYCCVQLHPERFFISCPALEQLLLNANTFNLTRSSWDACPPPSVTKLLDLTVIVVDCDECTAVVVRTFAHPGMLRMEVETEDVNTATARLMIATLDDSDALHLDLVGDEYELNCVVLDAARHRRRTFVHSEDEEISDMNPEEPLVPAFAHVARRFTRLSVSDSAYAWNHLLLLFPEEPLASVQTLKLRLTKASFADFEPARKLALPALTHIKLAAEKGTGTKTVDADDLLYFVESFLDLPEGWTLKLALKNVQVGGDTDLLSDHFECDSD